LNELGEFRLREFRMDWVRFDKVSTISIVGINCLSFGFYFSNSICRRRMRTS